MLLGVVVVAAWVPYLYRHVDEQIRCRIEERLAEHYADLKVAVRCAELIDGEGIVLRDVTIVEPNAEGPHPELAHWEEVVLACQTQLTDLVQHEPEVTQITIRRPTLRATRRRDGSWSVARLLPPPKTNNRPVETVIEGGTIEIFDPLRTPAAAITLRDVNLVFRPLEEGDHPGHSPAARRVQGSLTADHLERVEIEGVFDPEQGFAAMVGCVEGINVSPELHAALPEPLAEQLVAAVGLRGVADVKFQVNYDRAAPQPLAYQLTGRLARGRIDDPRLPHPLTDLRTRFRADTSGVTIDELTARSNQAAVRLNYRQDGFDAAAPKLVEVELRELELDRRLLAALPPALQDHWYKYRPAGTIDADVKLAFDGRAWRPELLVRCLNVSFSHYKFPYRLDEGKGTLTLKDDVLKMNLTASDGHESIRLVAELNHPGPAATGWCEVRGDDVQLDDKLLAALPETARPVMQSLNARGGVSVYMRMWRDTPDEAMHKHLLLGANRCSLQFEKFPYPVRNIRGTLEMFDDSWSFRNLEGINDTGRITCDGYFSPSLEGKELRLHFTGRDVPLDEELREALRPAERQVWSAFRPRGIIDLVADVRYLAETKQLSVAVRAEPQAAGSAIEPVHFPYRLERLRGVLEYHDGRVTLQHIQAEHGSVRLSTGGSCEFLPDGRWRLRLENLTVDRLRFDRDFIPAIPDRLKRALVDLKPSGAVNLRGTFELASMRGPSEPLQSRWDLALGLQQCAVDCGQRLENVSGSLTLCGEFDGERFQNRGELALDSLTCRDIQITELSGPIWIDEQQILLGAWVAKRLNAGAAPTAALERPRSLTGRLFRGTLQGDGWVQLGPEAKYGVHAELIGADLTRCVQEFQTGKQNIRGAVHGAVDLRGSGRSVNALAGRGTLQLRDADIYELPFMISLLKILSIRAPDKTAFSRSDIGFRIEGEHLYFDQLDFNGDAISLLGKGEMDFQQNVALAFNAIVGRGESSMPVVKEIFSGAAKQIMLIRVTGNLHDPKMSREPFPGVNQALQQLQSERRGDEGEAKPARVWRDRRM